MPEIAIGDQVNGVITSIIPADCSNQKTKVFCDLGIEGWTCSVQFNIAVENKRKLLRVGDEIDGWVIRKHAANRFLAIGISDFGRFPPKTDTLTGYIDATSATKCSLLEVQDRKFVLPAPQSLSCMKGMLTRCVKKDQWDWLIVYRAFGFADDDTAYTTRKHFLAYQQICKTVARETQDVSLLTIAVHNLLDCGFLARLDRAISVFAEADNEWKAIKVPTPIRSSLTRKTLESPDEAVFSLTLHQPSAEQIRDSVVQQAAACVLTERANSIHAILVKKMSSLLAAHGSQPYFNGLIDLFCKVANTTFIFEMKSTTPSNILSQIRKGVSQLYEYRYLHDMRDATLVLVLDRAPMDDWVVDYLLQDRDICICWLSEDGFEFPSIAQTPLSIICGQNNCPSAQHPEI
jgi:hypothetical protein